MKPGSYKYKIGVVDKLGIVVFSEWTEFDMEENGKQGNGKEYTMHLEWDEVLAAKSYFLEITTPAGKIVKAYKTKTSQKDFNSLF